MAQGRGTAVASKSSKAKKGTQRKLTAILCADVVGYSRLIAPLCRKTLDKLLQAPFHILKTEQTLAFVC